MGLKDFDFSDDVLAHYGILGMKWGVRRQRGRDGTVKSGLAGKMDRLTNRITPPKGREPVTVQALPGKRVQTKGGRGARPSEDAKRAAAMKQIARSSTVDALSNKQLEAVIKRMQLERTYSQLDPPRGAKAWINKFLKQNGKELVPLGYSVAVASNPKLAANPKARAAAQLLSMAAGGKLPAEQKKKEKDK